MEGLGHGQPPSARAEFLGRDQLASFLSHQRNWECSKLVGNIAARDDSKQQRTVERRQSDGVDCKHIAEIAACIRGESQRNNLA